MAPNRSSSSELRRWAELVLPWLPPRDLAAAAMACKALHLAATSITARRSADGAQGLEKHPIPFFNPVDSQPYSFFLYSAAAVLRSPSSQPWGGDSGIPLAILSSRSDFASLGVGSGCDCERCDAGRCPCFSSDSGGGMPVLMECGTECECGLDCGNRVTQSGVSVRLMVVKNLKKGWGLHAVQFVQKGEFICEYAGEFLTTEEARRRQRVYDELGASGKISPALLVVREHLPSGKACLRVNIDATRIGNVARFINHSCDGGNLLAVLVRNSGSLLPRLCFFAATDLQEGEELTFSYGEARIRENGLRCFCGNSGCLGVLPSEET